jgi:hypothetical protein
MGAWTEIVDFTFTANETSRTFSGLNITKDDFIKVVVTHVNSSGSVLNPALRANSSINSNYTVQVLRGDGSTVGANRAGTNVVDEIPANKTSTSVTYLKLSENDRLNLFNNTTKTNDSGINVMFNYTTSSGATFTSGITSLTYDSGVANSLGTGSRIQIYRLDAEKVADITVASNTTQVDISSLSIGKDSEYLLVSDLSNSGAQVNSYRLFANDNTTDSNYYSQRIGGGGSSAYAGRFNVPYLSIHESNQRALSYVHIKLSEIGAYTYQSYVLSSLGTSSIFLENYFGSSTAENFTSITKLNVVGATNSIGSGSRFMLYKLK